MSTERAQEFRSPRDAEAARRNLDRDCAIPIDQFAGLVGQCIFPESDWVPCQLESNGSVCRQLHGKGWIARRRDGKEGYIGQICARHHFPETGNFRAEARRISRELEVDSLVVRLSAVIHDPEYERRLRHTETQLRELRERVSDQRGRWPAALLRRLEDMVKTGNRSVSIEFRFDRVDDDGNNVYEWQPWALATIVAPDAMSLAPLGLLSKRLQAANRTYRTAKPTRAERLNVLRQWAKDLDELGRCERGITDHQSGLAAFLQPDNLRPLCWTVRTQGDQLKIVRAVLELAGSLSVSDGAVHRVIGEWRAEICKKHKAGTFRIK